MGVHDFSLYDLICRNAQCFQNRPAWFEADTQATVTFEQFKAEVDRLAAGLQKAGIKSGDRIGVVGKNSLAFFQLFGAAAALGAIILPINWRLSGGGYSSSSSLGQAFFQSQRCRPLRWVRRPDGRCSL